MLEKYKRGGAGKREACSQLMDTTHQRLKSITVTAADYDSLMVIQAARRLYAHSSDSHINIEQSIDLTRKFALGYEKFKEVKHCTSYSSAPAPP